MKSIFKTRSLAVEWLLKDTSGGLTRLLHIIMNNVSLILIGGHSPLTEVWDCPLSLIKRH